MDAAFLLINRIIFRSQPGKSQSSINSLHSLTTNCCFLSQSHSKTSHCWHVQLITARTVGSPTRGRVVEESFLKARAQKIHHCPSAWLQHTEKELKTLMEDEKKGGESEAQLPVDKEWTKISTVSPLPLTPSCTPLKCSPVHKIKLLNIQTIS